MNKFMSIAAATAAFAVAAPASAATVVTLLPGTNTAGPNFVNVTPQFGDPLTADGSFKFVVLDNDANNGAFSVTYNFVNPFPTGSDGTASASFSVNAGQQTITFTGANINGSFIDLETADQMNSGFIMVWNNLNAGNNQFTIFGTVDAPNGVGSTTIEGGLTINAIPEPATWALFILGFGAIGGAMRRRGQQITSAKAKLNFA